jgi:hypothetical protein
MAAADDSIVATGKIGLHPSTTHKPAIFRGQLESILILSKAGMTDNHLSIVYQNFDKDAYKGGQFSKILADLGKKHGLRLSSNLISHPSDPPAYFRIESISWKPAE